MTNLDQKLFGTLPNGEKVYLFTLSNDNGVQVLITNYGASITSILTPDEQGNVSDIVLGYDTLEGYVQDKAYLGCVVGRCANRIDGSTFTLEGTSHTLASNRAPDHLHGGDEGFDKKCWQVRYAGDNGEGENTLMLSHWSHHGDEGYPANLSVYVTYTLTDENVLKIEYLARTDASTVCNLTNHSYFNLKDGGASSILDHEIWVDADAFTPMNERSIPTGEIRSVEGTPHDFRQAHAIGARIGHEDEQLNIGKGYDHSFVLNHAEKHPPKQKYISQNLVPPPLIHAVTVQEPTSGRTLEVWTTQPAVQLYTGNYLDGSAIGKKGVAYSHRSGFCLETQHYPDAVHHEHFPTITLHPSEVYHHLTYFKFGTRKNAES